MKKVISVFLIAILLTCAAFPAFAEDGRQYIYSSYKIPFGSMRMTAHRGYSSIAPENTLPSFRLAGEYRFWGAECDTSPTSDGIWVIMHDETVDRTTNGEGRVNDLTYAEISELTIDCGANIDDYPETRIPTLEQYLEYKMHAVIEIKGSAKVEDMDSLASILSAREEKDMFVIISFERKLIARIKALLPDTLAYLLSSPAVTDDIDFCLSNGLDGIDFSCITPEETVKEIRKAGLKTMVWTVDDIGTAENYCKWGVRDITTNSLTQARPDTNLFQSIIYKLSDWFYTIVYSVQLFFESV